MAAGGGGCGCGGRERKKVGSAPAGSGVTFPGLRPCELRGSKLRLSWARAPSPCCSRAAPVVPRPESAARCPVRLFSLAARCRRRRTLQSALTRFHHPRGKQNKTENAGSLLLGLQFPRPRLSLQLHPQEVPRRLIGNRSDSLLAEPACVGDARSHSRDSQALELTPLSPKCALGINYLPEIPKAGT